MSGPRVLLGVLSPAGGVLNLPELVGGGQRLQHWLEPVTKAGAALMPEAHVGAATEWTLIGIAVVVALTGIVGAMRLLRPEALVSAKQAPPETGLGKVLWKKWYVDEISEPAIGPPIIWVSRP